MYQPGASVYMNRGYGLGHRIEKNKLSENYTFQVCALQNLNGYGCHIPVLVDVASINKIAHQTQQSAPVSAKQCCTQKHCQQ